MRTRRQLVVEVHSVIAPISGDVVDAHGVERPFVGWLALCSALDRAITSIAADTTAGGGKHRGRAHEAKQWTVRSTEQTGQRHSGASPG
jgi:hypothetical protein